MTITCDSKPQLQPATAGRTRSTTVGATKLPGSRTKRARGEKYFAALAEATGQLVWTAHPDGSAVDARAWSAFSGVKEEQLLGWGWLQRVHADDRERAKRYWKRAVASEAPFELEYRMRRRDGAYRWFAVRAVPVRDAGGVIEWVSAAADVTDRRQHKHARKDEERERTLAADVNCGGVSQSPPAGDMTSRFLDRRIVEANGIGAPMRTTEGGSVGAAPVCRDVAAGRQIERQSLERRTRETLHALVGMAEMLVGPVGAARTSTTSGTSAVIRRLGELARSVLGCERLSIMALESGTDRLTPLLRVGWPAQVEEQWNAQEGRFQLHDVVPDVLIERLRVGEVVVHDVARTAPPGWQVQGVGLLLLAPLRIKSQLIGLLSLDYGDRPHQYITDERLLAGAVAQLVAVVIERERLLREREEARASELAAREATKRMELFMAMASHEFRTPLTVIKGYLQLAQQYLGPRLPSGEIPFPINQALLTARESLALASGAAVRMSALLDDLLQVSRAQAGKLLVRTQRCDLSSIVRASVDELRQMNSTRQVCLHLPVNRPIYVIADPERVGQVVTNYLANAFKYSPEDQPVDVRVQARRQTARVSVCDRGPGLSVADKKHIWERYYQAAGVDRQAGTDVGLGLGLYVCRMIIEQHEGRVGAESRVGRGSTFWFTLPLSTDRT